MLRTTLRSLLARKLRLAMSASAVVLGVAFVVGAFVLTDTLGRTFTDAFATANKDVAVDVRGAEKTDAGLRREVPEAAVEKVRAVDGVAEVQPVLRSAGADQVGVLGPDGKALSTGGAPLVAGNWVDSERLNSQRIATGRPPRAPGEVTMDTTLADKASLKVGDRTQVFTATGQQEVTLVGLTRYADGEDSVGGEAYVLFSTDAARKVLDVSGYTDLYVAADGVDQDELRRRVADVLPDGTEAITGAQLADEQAADLEQGTRFLNTFLLVFATVSLFVGAFIIFNTFSILVAQRTRELALMRALGASKRQVTWSVLLEALVVGGLSSVLGLVAGVGVAVGLQALFGAIGAGLPSATPVIEPRTVVAAIATGVLITAGSALLPARRAASVPPIAAMRDATRTDRPLRRTATAGALLTVAGAVAMAVGLAGGQLAVLGAGTMLAFLGIALLSPVISRPVTGGLGRLFGGSLPGRLGRQNSLRDPRRTATTAAALMIGLALVAAVGVLGASLKESVRSGATTALGADLIVTPVVVGVPAQAVEAVRNTAGTRDVTGLRGGSALVGGQDASVTALDKSAFGGTVRLRELSGRTGDLAAGTILVSDDAAAERGLSTGSTVPVTWPDGKREDLKVVGTYKSNQVVGSYLVDGSAADHFPDQLYTAVLVRADGDAAAVESAVERSLRPFPNVLVQDRREFIGDATGQVDQLVRFLQLLLAMSVGIAVLGVVNTLALSVLERTRELGLLRAVGMSRRQVKQMVRVESILVSVFGGLLGLAVGVVFGVALQRALVDQGVTELSLPVPQLLGYLLLAGLAGVLAAWLPARRAAGLDVLKAVSAD